MSSYIQIGVTALRDPVTGEIARSVPMYVRAKDVGVSTEAEAAEPMAENIAPVFAAMMKTYVDGCRKAGVPF